MAQKNRSNVLEIKNLNISLKNSIPLISALTLEIKRGAITALLGESGAGKSLLSAAILGLLPMPPFAPPTGTITFEGMDLLKLSRKKMQQLRGAKIGIVFQEPKNAFNPVFSIGSQLMEVAELHLNLPFQQARERVKQTLVEVGLDDVERVLSAYPHELSGGMLQRALIAMAILPKPTLLIADEPTTALDVTIQAQILELLRSLKKKGLTILLITHDLGVVAEVAEEVFIIREGKLMERASCFKLFEAPSHPYTQSLFKARDFCINQLPVEAKKEIILEAKGLKKAFNSQLMAVNDVSFRVAENEIVGIVGESGSGKSTLALLLANLLEPTSGTIHFKQGNIFEYNSAQKMSFRRQLQMIFQDPFATLNPKKRIFNILWEAMRLHNQAKDKHEALTKIEELLSAVGLPFDAMMRYPHAFSGGQRQRIAIARALSVNPTILICDEILSALDLSIQAMMLSLLSDLKQRYGLTLLFISHDLSTVKRFCNRVLVFYRGKIVEEGAVEAIFNSPQHPYTQQLLASIPKRYPDGISC